MIVKRLKKWYHIINSVCRNVRKRGMTVKKLDDIISMLQENELIGRELLKKKEEEKEDKVLWIFAIIGVIALAAAIAYAIYRYLTPDYLDDFDDVFEDDYEDDYFDDEDDELVEKKSEE